jgi:type VI secretion system secreted protein Hcp
MPQFDIYLKLAGFKGEVTASNYRDDIAVLSYQQGIVNPTQPGAGGGGGAGGRPTFSDVRFRKPLDRSTPRLMVACASGQHVAQARFAFVRVSSGAPNEFYRVTLTNVVITGINQIAGDGTQYPLSFNALDAGSDTGGILEEISLSYVKIVWEYVPTDEHGQPQAPIKGGWDLASNSEI